MAKIIRMFNKEEADREALVKHIEDLLEAAKNGDIKNILVSATNSDGDIIAGYCNLGVGEKQYMLGHMQVDITYQVIEANVDRLIEIVK